MPREYPSAGRLEGLHCKLVFSIKMVKSKNLTTHFEYLVINLKSKFNNLRKNITYSKIILDKL